MTEQKEKLYKAAIEYLMNVAKGRIALVQDDTAPTAETNTVQSATLDQASEVSFTDGGRIFTPSNLRRL